MFLIMNENYRFIDPHAKWTNKQESAKEFRTENAAKVWINQYAPNLKQSTIIVPKE